MNLLFLGMIAGFILVLFVVFKIFKSPGKVIFKFILNSAIGFCCLILFNFLTPFTGLSLGANLTNALIIGALGAPGFGLLLLIRWIFVT